MFKQPIVGSILLIAGTSIGAGMLALPVTMAPLGLATSVVLLVLVWAVMCYTGLLVIEANLWLPENTSYISMAGQTLGRIGQAITALAFLMLLYSLLAAYITAAGAIVVSAAQYYLGYPVSLMQGNFLAAFFLAIIIYSGTLLSDWINRLMMLGLFASFFILVFIVIPHVKLMTLNHPQFRYFWVALPILLTSFGYHIVLPSMRDYLHSHIKLLRISVIIGSALPLCFYLIWELVVFGVVPLHGTQGLLAILKTGQPATFLSQAISMVSRNVWLGHATRSFEFFAVSSSFIGVSLGLFDLLADGLRIKKNLMGKTFLILLTFLPAFVFAVSHPNGFILALGYAGVFVALLHGILPAMMVWMGRYHLQFENAYRVFGGKWLLSAIILFSLIVVFAQLAVNFSWIAVG